MSDTQDADYFLPLVYSHTLHNKSGLSSFYQVRNSQTVNTLAYETLFL